MPATDALYRVLQAQATLDNTRATAQDTAALAQQRMLGVLLNTQAQQRNDQLREILKSDPQFNNPTGGAAGPLANYDYDSPMIQSARNAQQGIVMNQKLLDAARQVGDIDLIRKASADHDNQQKEYRLAMMDVTKDDERRNKEAAQAFGQVQTGEDAQQALQYVNDNLGPKQAKAIGQQLANALPGGFDNATPEQIQKAIEPIVNRYNSRGNVLRFNSTVMASADRQVTQAQNQQKIDAAAAAKQAGTTDVLAGDALDLAAEKYLATGTLPQLYRDAASRKAVIGRAAELQAGQGGTMADVPGQQAEFKATSIAMNAVTKDLAAIRPYNNMLEKNADILKGLAKNVIKTDVNLANKPINWIQKNVAGDADVAEYLSQMTIVQTEAARVLNNPRLVGQLTDSARHEMQNVIDGNMTLEQTDRVIDRLKSDGQNRVKAIEDEYNSLRKDLRRGGKEAPVVAGNTTQAKTVTEDVMNKQTAPLTPAQIGQVAKMKGIAAAPTKEAYDALPPGTVYIGPSGIPRTK